ncbi:intracellular protein transport-like protein [Hirsutella rhossiliensis]|uniref:Intracellular protein transport-like protein n=1 Tax=Hirsutella rhossiliensis TaxID=111463 RepID=A0A9P8SLQ1_9HYPO|nr:intracellular protein transport-like protein [Hirsutella rhossiliensis]KAH0967186.1 intracellular protein transport-like protein [Hirsutella rhossiliensis]
MSPETTLRRTTTSLQVHPPTILGTSTISLRLLTPSVAAWIPIKRKPLSSTAASPRSLPGFTPLATDQPHQRFARPLTLDSPTLYDFSPSSSARPLRHSYQSPTRTTPVDADTPAARSIPSDHDGSPLVPATELSDVLSEYDDLISERSVSDADAACDGTSTNIIDDSSDDVDSRYDAEPSNNNLLPPPMFAPKPVPPHLRLQQVDISLTHLKRQSISESISPESARLSKPQSKSPSQASPFTSLFGWSNLSPSVTDFSSILSPLSPSRKDSADDALHANQTWSDSSKANAATANPINYCESYLSTPPPSQALSSVQVEEMEEELKAISSELAASIRREMDLEDLVDRLQDQVSNPQAPSKRTSDYFSDSGYSSAKLSDHEQSREEVEKIQRRSEQEKASIRLELTNKLQDERSKRKALDQQIKELAEKASQMDLANINSLDANGRVRDLENTCEDLRRRLSEERDSKNNFEDLLAALKGELRVACNERDNLRDEVVPQLRARVEGLESEAASYANLTYESTKMQQQLQSLQQENTSLRNSPASMSDEFGGLTQSNSAATGSFRPRAPLVASGLSRSDSVKNVQAESREQLAERLKDVEAQRDALHSALKNLLERQEFQNRENQKKIEILETERQRLLAESPKKAGFERDIANLRTEINVLRRRAEDALEQKWQMEKGLVGLKMDLDRAEEEIASLRSLLKEKDILIPPSMARSSSPGGATAAPITSDSLEKAYRELQDAYQQSLDRIKRLETDSVDGLSDEKTKLAMQRLEQALSAATFERDAAKQHARSLQSQISSLTDIESKSTAREKELADELSESAQRVEQLASEVRQQLSKNAELRDRLSNTVTRGDADRKANSERISGLQERLHALEEQLVAAQTASEDRVGRHEEEISQLREAHNEQLRRINNGSGVGRMSTPKSPLLRSETGMFGRSSQSIATKSFEEASLIKELRERVTELEKALVDAEKEIQQVVGKMSEAQIEVMNLQEERETALRETRRLQKTLADEQAKAFEERFKTLNGMAA